MSVMFYWSQKRANLKLIILISHNFNREWCFMEGNDSLLQNEVHLDFDAEVSKKGMWTLKENRAWTKALGLIRCSYRISSAEIG